MAFENCHKAHRAHEPITHRNLARIDCGSRYPNCENKISLAEEPLTL